MIKTSLTTRSTVSRRLEDTSAAILGDAVDDPGYLHVIMSQVGLPYRDPKTDFYSSRTGRAWLALTAGVLRDQHSPTGWAKPGLPFGTRPRMLMLYLCTYAVQHRTATVSVEDSMTALMRELGITATGGKEGSIARFKDQMNRLAAVQMQFAMDYGDYSTQFNMGSVVRQAELWFPSDGRQLTLWPSEVRLSSEFYESLCSRPLPVDPRAFRALLHNARAMDLYTWLAHRLRRVKEKNGAFITWQALRQQFGPEIADINNFRRQCLIALKQVKSVYPAANFRPVEGGLRIFYSPPAIAERISIRAARIGPKLIEGTAKEVC